MQVEKISVSLPASLVKFVEDYKSLHQKKSRSEVIEEAVKLLREQELEKAYREANQEIDETWDTVVADGLTDETW
ncbi:hypothetical protein NUACC21_47490 [Scytonema sp. NUACC21]